MQKRWSAISGPRAQFYFVVAELRRRVPPAGTPHKKACTTLANHRDELLAFSAESDDRLAALAGQFQVEPGLVRAEQENRTNSSGVADRDARKNGKSQQNSLAMP